MDETVSVVSVAQSSGQHSKTSDENIFCVGDAAGQPHLAHAAYHERKVAGGVAAGEYLAFDNEYIPAVMFTDPEVAVVGLTETDARNKYGDIKVGTFPLDASGRTCGKFKRQRRGSILWSD